MADYRLSKTGPRIDDILDNSARQDAIAIVSNGNTHIAITSGQYVYVKNHGTLAEGLYKANSNISANGTLTSSNLTAVSNGVANDLKAALSGKIGGTSSLINQFNTGTDMTDSLFVRNVIREYGADDGSCLAMSVWSGFPIGSLTFGVAIILQNNNLSGNAIVFAYNHTGTYTGLIAPET